MLYNWSTQAKPSDIVVVDITLATGWTAASSADNYELVGWKVVSVFPKNIDFTSVLKSVSLSASWAITLTAVSNGTASSSSVYSVSVAPITGDTFAN